MRSCINFMCLDNVHGLCYGGGCFRNPEPEEQEQDEINEEEEEEK